MLYNLHLFKHLREVKVEKKRKIFCEVITMELLSMSEIPRTDSSNLRINCYLLLQFRHDDIMTLSPVALSFHFLNFKIKILYISSVYWEIICLKYFCVKCVL